MNNPASRFKASHLITRLLSLFLLVGMSFPLYALANAPSSQGYPSSIAASNSPDYRLSLQQGAELSRIEMTLFKASYPQEAVFSRLNRIESTLYGETQESTPPADRLVKLKTFFERPSSNTTAQGNGTLQPLEGNSPGPSNIQASNTQVPAQAIQNKPRSYKPLSRASKNRSKTKLLTPQPVLDIPKEMATTTSSSTIQPNPAMNNSGINIQQPIEQNGDNTVDYPRIDAMEQQVFGQVSSNMPLSQRIERLETKVFGQTGYGELMERVDLLSNRLLANHNQSYSPRANGSTAPYNPYSSSNPYNPYQNNPYLSQNPYQANSYPHTPYPAAPPLQTYNPPPGVGNPVPGMPPGALPENTNPENSNIDPDFEAYGQVPGGLQQQQPQYGAPVNAGNYDPNFLNALSQTEKRVLKSNFPNDPPQVRLGRMETKLFHTQAPPSVSEEDRLQRIIAVQAGGGGTGNPMTDRGSTLRSILPILLMIVPLLL